jgi:murein DD-endopeptidase MepM/ murein hydrolase activator NlpD
MHSRPPSSILSPMQLALARNLAWCAVLLAAASFTSAAPPDAVTLTPAIVVAGSPELIRVSALPSAVLEGEWQGKQLAFFRGRDGHSWFALAGVDVEAAVGPSKLTLIEKDSTGRAIDLSRDVEINPARYATGTLTVEPKFVEPPPEQAERIKSEIDLKTKIFSSSAAQPLWSGNFHAPVTAPSTSSFGMRRTYNGKLASVHKGMDFRSPSGTPVRAGNSGIVVLARPLYFEGNCVVIDHGLGLFTVSMHLSRIDVHEGQHVSLGQQIGLSGATGRVTGPHLHWSVRWQDASLDPAKLLRMDLSAAR